MAKLLKIVGRIIGTTFEWVLILLIAFAFAIRTSSFQTYLGELATSYLSKELDAELRIGKIDVIFFDKVLLKDVFVRDQQGDTLASLEAIDVRVKNIDLSGNKLVLKNVGLFDGRVGIKRDKVTGDYNYWFITDYFDSGSKKTKKSDPLDVEILSLDLSSIDFTYDDNRKGYSDYGMDYDHIHCKNVELHAKHFKIGDGTFAFYLAHLSTRERCGLSLRKFRTYCKIDQEKGIFLADMSIETSRTKLYSKQFYLRMSTLAGIHSFEDSVTFDAIIDSSRVHLTDVSYFAPALEGMDQTIALSGELHRKVKDLRIDDIDLRFGKRSVVQGDFILPDFRFIQGSPFKESVRYAFIDLADLTALKLPKKASQRYITLDPMVERLGFVELKKTGVSGTTDQFLMASQQMTTQLGTVHVDNGLTFQGLKEGGYAFERTENSNFDVYVDSFQLGKFIDNSLFGKVNGSVYLSGVVGQKDVIRINKLTGLLNSFGFNSYNYSNISVENGSFIDNVFAGTIAVNDPHLVMTYDGKIDVSKKQHFDFEVSIPRADLGVLNFVKDPNATLISDMKIAISGTDLSNYSGRIDITKLGYQENNKLIGIPSLVLDIQRGLRADRFNITSNVANVELVGKVHPNTIAPAINNLVSRLMPTVVPLMKVPKSKHSNDFFDLIVNVGDPKEVLDLFAPEVHLAPQSKLVVHYNDQLDEETLDFTSDELAYETIREKDTLTDRKYLQAIELKQSLIKGEYISQFNATHAEINDSLFVGNLDIAITGKNGLFVSNVKWNQDQQDPADFKFITNFKPEEEIEMVLKPSYFTVKGQLWEIQNTAEFIYAQEKVIIDHLVLERDVQFLAINGVLSNDEKDNVSLDLNDIHIEEFSSFINTDLELKGRLNGRINFSTPFTTFKANGDLTAKDFYVNKEEIGDIAANGIWDGTKERMVLDGDLNYLKNETFKFSGYYYPMREENDIDFMLDFYSTDIQFANGFMDPEVLSDIKGKLSGRLTVRGNSDDPEINGRLKLVNGSVKVGILGTTYKMNGPIVFDGDNSAFYIDNMPVTDEENNIAVLNATVGHEKFENWSANIDCWFDDETVRAIYNRPFTGKFLALNTRYKEGDIYYGKAYATGYANILIQEGQTDITVNARSEKGTWIDLPMYGPSDVSEFDFITFGDSVSKQVNRKVDLTGVNMDLMLTATPEADLRLIFNEKTGDIISAKGLGTLNIVADNFGQIKMNGQYVIAAGKYNFVLPPIKQAFVISPGGSITWTGNPYDANLDISAYNIVNASLKELTNDVTGGTSSSSKEEIHCIINIANTISNPSLTLDIDAPSATESGKQVLNSIKSNPDDLQKQFFTLLVMKRFAPTNGQSQQGLGGAADVLTEQINAALDGLSKEIKFKVGYDGSGTTSTTSTHETTFGFRTALGENKSFVITGDFGVANSTTGQTSSNTLIGNMSIEYLINDDGSFSIAIFNESNDKGALTEKWKGDYTQGMGLHYKEEFNSFEESKTMKGVSNVFKKQTYQPLMDRILNLFRRKEKRVHTKPGKKMKPVNPSDVTPNPSGTEAPKKEIPGSEMEKNQ